MFDIAALGEALIDFAPCSKNEMGNPMYSQNPGGAPANVLAMASKLGASTAFLGKVGDDSFGHFLNDRIMEAGVDTKGLVISKEHNTTLAFVTLSDSGDRSFSFYRDRTADVMLEERDVDTSILSSCRIFHFGSVSMTNDPARTTTINSAIEAKKNGAVISFDPNYRPLLWKHREDAKKVITSVIPYCDIIKVSDEEMELITNVTDLERGSELLLNMGPRIVLVTMGERGSFIRTKDFVKKYETYSVPVVDTTGAGDAFVGAFLYSLISLSKDNKQVSLDIDSGQIDGIMNFCNAAGSLTTRKKGAIPAMPTRKEIDECINKGRIS